MIHICHRVPALCPRIDRDRGFEEAFACFFHDTLLLGAPVAVGWCDSFADANLASLGHQQCTRRERGGIAIVDGMEPTTALRQHVRSYVAASTVIVG